MFKDLFYESTPRKVLAPAVNSVIFMAQRPNIAMLIVRASLREFYQIQLDLREFYQIQLSVNGCWEMKVWLYQKLIQICERLGFWQ